MTNGRGAGMASFMTKKKKYKFQVDICLEELLEVPFVSAVLFAKLRLSDGGNNFQGHSSREEVKNHEVKWNAKFSFTCKMMANASTGVLERCILRISIRKECKGGRSFTKLGFVDLNLAEYAGAGITYKKALLEGYDTRHRQDNSMLKFSIHMNLLSGDILFKVPSPSLKHKSITAEDPVNEQRSDEFSSGSLGGSIASGSSGFGSLPKKRPPLLSSDLVIGCTLPESNIPITVASDCNEPIPSFYPEHHVEEGIGETGHSRNSSNTSQLSKASGYSSIHSHSHSRQSSSGDSGHIRSIPQRPNRKTNLKSRFPNNISNFIRINTYPNRSKISHSVHTVQEESYGTPPQDSLLTPHKHPTTNGSVSNAEDHSIYYTPKAYDPQVSNSSNEDYKTPDDSFNDVYVRNYFELKKSSSTSVVERLKPIASHFDDEDDDNNEVQVVLHRRSDETGVKPSYLDTDGPNDGVARSKSEFEIPRIAPIPKNERRFPSLYSFLTPRPKRKDLVVGAHSTPNRKSPTSMSLKMVHAGSPISQHRLTRNNAMSLGSVATMNGGDYGQQQLGVSRPVYRSLPHRKLLEGTSGGKLAPLAISPDDTPATVSSDCSHILTIRRPSVTTNPSSSSLVLSETGSLDRAKAAYERRKKVQLSDNENVCTAPGRVEITRVNPDDLIAELIKNTNLEQNDDSAETSGLQLFIAKDGTAALGNHEVKSQMSTGAQVFKQVVMDDNR